jgi:hypothetical protein
MTNAPWESVPPGATLLACSLCGAAVPMTSAQVTHMRDHQRRTAAEQALAGLDQAVTELAEAMGRSLAALQASLSPTSEG